MATQTVSKIGTSRRGRDTYRWASQGTGDDGAPVKGLLENDGVIVSLVGTVTATAWQTRMLDTDAWAPCTASITAANCQLLTNVMDQLRPVVTTGTAVIATAVVLRR